MTRSDIVLNRVKMDEEEITEGEKLDFVDALIRKIDNVYSILYVMEKDKHFDGLSKLLREALEK